MKTTNVTSKSTKILLADTDDDDADGDDISTHYPNSTSRILIENMTTTKKQTASQSPFKIATNARSNPPHNALISKDKLKVEFGRYTVIIQKNYQSTEEDDNESAELSSQYPASKKSKFSPKNSSKLKAASISFLPFKSLSETDEGKLSSPPKTLRVRKVKARYVESESSDDNQSSETLSDKNDDVLPDLSYSKKTPPVNYTKQKSIARVNRRAENDKSVEEEEEEFVNRPAKADLGSPAAKSNVSESQLTESQLFRSSRKNKTTWYGEILNDSELSDADLEPTTSSGTKTRTRVQGRLPTKSVSPFQTRGRPIGSKAQVNHDDEYKPSEEQNSTRKRPARSRAKRVSYKGQFYDDSDIELLDTDDDSYRGKTKKTSLRGKTPPSNKRDSVSPPEIRISCRRGLRRSIKIN